LSLCGSIRKVAALPRWAARVFREGAANGACGGRAPLAAVESGLRPSPPRGPGLIVERPDDTCFYLVLRASAQNLTSEFQLSYRPIQKSKNGQKIREICNDRDGSRMAFRVKNAMRLAKGRQRRLAYSWARGSWSMHVKVSLESGGAEAK
jgi:hypothetical protein